MHRVRELTGVSCAYKQGIFGDGIGVAVLDSGVNERTSGSARQTGLFL